MTDDIKEEIESEVQAGCAALCDWFSSQDTPPAVALAIMASVSAAILARPPESIRLSKKVLRSDFHQLVDASIKQIQKQKRNKR